jgi:hypothetical protein
MYLQLPSHSLVRVNDDYGVGWMSWPTHQVSPQCPPTTVSGCLDVSKSGSMYIGRHVHPRCTSSAGTTYLQTCRGPQQMLLLVKTFVLVPVESFGIGGELKCTWRLPKTNTMYVEPGPAEQDNFFKVCSGNLSMRSDLREIRAITLSRAQERVVRLLRSFST